MLGSVKSSDNLNALYNSISNDSSLHFFFLHVGSATIFSSVQFVFNLDN